MDHLLRFDMLAGALRERGYAVDEETVDGCAGRMLRFSGQGVRGAAGTDDFDAYGPYLHGCAAADNADAFNKWSQAPLVLRLPCDPDRLWVALEWLATADGYTYSNEFAFETELHPLVPRDMFPAEHTS